MEESRVLDSYGVHLNLKRNNFCFFEKKKLSHQFSISLCHIKFRVEGQRIAIDHDKDQWQKHCQDLEMLNELKIG